MFRLLFRPNQSRSIFRYYSGRVRWYDNVNTKTTTLGALSRNSSPTRRFLVAVTKTKVDELPNAEESTFPSAEETTAPTAAPQSSQELDVTDACYRRIQQVVAKKEGATLDSIYLRAFVDAGGCSGFSYQFEISSEELEEDDIIFADTSGARVVVDRGSLDIIKGSTVDYVQEMIKSGFEVKDNPQSESACGCGSSFAMKNFAANPAID